MTELRDELQELLMGYFGDQMPEQGVDEMVFVTESSPEYHQRYLGAIDYGLRAAEQGDESIATLLRESNAWSVQTAAEAADFLRKVRDDYLAKYAAATSDNTV